MASHQHRCCRRPTGAPAPIDPSSLDYILLAAHDANLIEGVATMLRGAGVAVERHDLGLRLNCRGQDWKGALAHLSDTLAETARRGLRVALVPITSDAVAFHRALITAQPLEAFARSLALAHTTATDRHPLGDVFKGESLE